MPELADFAVERHGFGNTDGGFGVTYPLDLDEQDREVNAKIIPDGQVEIYGFWGPPDGYSIFVPEVMYLQVLAGLLNQAGYDAESKRVEALFRIDV